MQGKRILQSGLDTAKQIAETVLGRSDLVELIVQHEELAKAAISPIASDKQKEVFLKYAAEMAERIERLVGRLGDPTHTPQKILDMLPSPAESAALVLQRIRRNREVVTELEQIALNPRMDIWSRSELVSTVDRNVSQSRGSFSEILKSNSAEDLHEAVHDYRIAIESGERATLMQIRAESHLSEEALKIFNGLIRASFSTQAKMISNAIDDPAVSKDYSYRLEEELAKLKDEHKAFLKSIPQQPDTEALVSELLDARTKPQKREEIATELLADAGEKLRRMLRGVMIVPLPVEMETSGNDEMDN